MDVAIICAEITGLACGARLAKAGCRVRLYDKGRGPDGCRGAGSNGTEPPSLSITARRTSPPATRALPRL